MQRTGRRIPGPGADLVEVVGAGDLKHSVLVFAPVFRDHACLNSELEVGMGFMEQPDVTGVARLVGHHPEDGAFVYPTGTVWSVAEIVRELADQGDSGGVKAGLELCFMAGEILVEAGDQGAHSGLVGHGSIDPWKILVKADGQVALVGYGLPRPEIEVHVEDESRHPSEDALRYCAPENLAAERFHDLSSDLFSLSLVALELMMGRPVYDGVAAEIKKAASRGEAMRKLYQWRDRIPEPVREVIGKAIKPDPDIRYRDGLDFVYSVHDLLSGIDAGDGPSLREVVTSVRARQKRGRAVVGGNTGALTKSELAELAADIDAEGVSTDLPAPRKPRPADDGGEDGEQPRWRRASRNASSPGVAPRSRGAARVRTADPAPERVASPRAAAERPTSDDDSARARLLRRLKERDDSAPRRRRPSMEPDGGASLSPDTQRGPPIQERRRRSGPDGDVHTVGGGVSLAPEPAPVASVAPAAAPPVAAGAPAPVATTPASPAPTPPPTAPVEDAPPLDPPTRSRPGGRAAALLERLRSTSGGRSRDEEPRPRTPRPVVPEEASAEVPTPRAPPRRAQTLVPDEWDAPVSEELPAPAAPTPAAPAPAAPATAAPAATVAPPASPEPPAVAAAPARQASPGPQALDQRPAPTPRAAAEEDATAAIDVRERNGLRVRFEGRTITVQREGTASRVADRAVDALELAVTDLMGARTAAFRLRQDGRAVPHETPARDLDGELELQRVRNQVVLATVEAPGDPAIRVKTPLGTAVPVGQLKRTLRELLAIDGAFELTFGGRVLGSDAVLADVGLGEDGSDAPVLRVTR